MEITKGKWYANKEGGVQCDTITERAKRYGVDNITNGEICQCWADFHNNKILPDSECMANANLIAEAGNVTQETGLTPKQLQEENENLKEEVRELRTLLNNSQYPNNINEI